MTVVIVFPQDHNYSFDIESAKSTVDMLRKRVVHLECRKRNATQREKRAKKRCKDILVELNEKNLLTAELEDKLSAYKR